VGIYILNTFSCKIITELSPFDEKEFESLTIEMTHKNKKIMLWNIYRSPTHTNGLSNATQMENFNTKLDDLLQNMYRCGPEVLVFLDANINLLKLTSSKPALDYLETIHSNGFLQLIPNYVYSACCRLCLQCQLPTMFKVPAADCVYSGSCRLCLQCLLPTVFTVPAADYLYSACCRLCFQC
jgi:hypothetical protein